MLLPVAETTINDSKRRYLWNILNCINYRRWRKVIFNIQFIEALCISEKQFDWTWFKPLLSTRSVCRISKLYNVIKHVTVPGRNTLKPTRRHVKQSTYERWKLHQAAQRWFVLCKKKSNHFINLYMYTKCTTKQYFTGNNLCNAALGLIEAVWCINMRQ